MVEGGLAKVFNVSFKSERRTKSYTKTYYCGGKGGMLWSENVMVENDEWI